MTVEELLTRVSSRELTEWKIYADAEGLPGERGDLQAAMISLVMTNLWRDRKRTRRPKLSEFLPVFWRKKTQTWEEQLSMVEMLNAAFGGEDRRAHDR